MAKGLLGGGLGVAWEGVDLRAGEALPQLQVGEVGGFDAPGQRAPGGWAGRCVGGGGVESWGGPPAAAGGLPDTVMWVQGLDAACEGVGWGTGVLVALRP